MITKEEWDRLFDRAMPMVSVGIGALSLGIGIMSLIRFAPLGARVYYKDGQYLVSVRYPGQWHDLREFVQPSNPDVLAVYSQFGPDYWSLYDFVCQSISYRYDIGEFFQFPSETLRGHGDCEDTSILLTSLLRSGGVPNSYVVLGSLGGYGHSWCQLNGQILETTFTRARPVPDPEHYCPYVYFDDQDVLELWPGALDEVFDLDRDEAAKLKLIAQALGG